MADDRAANEPGVVTKLSPRPVADTTARLTGILGAKGVKLFTVIDQSAEARQVGLELRDTTLVIFGSPAAGTPVMAAEPLAALDLPLKVLVWDDAGQAKVSLVPTYWDRPSALVDVLLAAKLEGKALGTAPRIDIDVAAFWDDPYPTFALLRREAATQEGAQRTGPPRARGPHPMVKSLHVTCIAQVTISLAT